QLVRAYSSLTIRKKHFDRLFETAPEKCLHDLMQGGPGGGAGCFRRRIEIPLALLDVVYMAFLLQDTQNGSHRGVRGRIRQLLQDLANGGRGPSVQDLQDLALTPAEAVSDHSRHSNSSQKSDLLKD